MTESGKTTLAKRLAARYHQHEIPVLVLDSLNDPGWCPADTRDHTLFFQTTDPDEFLKVFWSSRRCVAFIDEAGDAVGRYNLVMQRTATRGRHWGHSVHFISQRGVQIAPTVRDQCGHLFLLTSSIADGRVHANEWNRPELLQCNALGKGNYFHCTRFGVLERGSLFGERNGFDPDHGDGRRELSEDQRARTQAPSTQEEATQDTDRTSASTGIHNGIDRSATDQGGSAERSTSEQRER